METLKHILKNVWKYLHRVFIALDQLINALCGGWPDETISAVCYRKSKEKGHYGFKLLKFILDVTLSPIKQDHCFESYYSEMKRSQLPDIYSKRS